MHYDSAEGCVEASRSPVTPPRQKMSSQQGSGSEAPRDSQDNHAQWSPPTPEILLTRRLEIQTTSTASFSPSTSPSHVDPVETWRRGVAVPQKKEEKSLSEIHGVSSSADAPQSTSTEASSKSASPQIQTSFQTPGHSTLTATLHQHLRHRKKVGSTFGSDASLANSSNAEKDIAQGAASPKEGVSCVSFSTVALLTSAASGNPTAVSLFSRIASFCDLATLVQCMRVSRAAHRVATGDAVWKPLFSFMNLMPLLAAYNREGHYYDFFVDDIVTARALYGNYTFQAAAVSATSDSFTGVRCAGKGAVLSRGREFFDEGDTQDDVFHVASIQLLISGASLGQKNHAIGRVQLLLTYKNDLMEVLQGSCRFSIHRRCFSLCCSAFGTVTRGPVFTVAIATVTKPWANESLQHFNEQKDGIRLVMTPVLWEGPSPGSKITENDILAVSRPKLTLSSIASAVDVTELADSP